MRSEGRIVYLSNTGLMEPLGQSQILAYLRTLAAARKIAVISLEKTKDLNDESRRRLIQAEIDACGIEWRPVRYRNRPAVLGSLQNLISVVVIGLRQGLSHRVDIIHARGFIPCVWGIPLKLLFGARLIFDTRGGSWAEQRADVGLLRRGSVLFRIAQRLESLCFRLTDAVVALSPANAEQMRKQPELSDRTEWVRVVTTCTNLELFTPAACGQRVRSSTLTLGYVGNAGLGYRFDAFLQFAESLKTRIDGLRLRIVNRDDHESIRRMLATRNWTGSVELIACDYPNVPAQMREMDLGAFFYQWPASQIPPVFTRMGEFLACGIPCVSNVGGIGGVDILSSERVGVRAESIDAAAFGPVADAALALLEDPGLSARCVAAAHSHFSLAAGVQVYERLYQDLGAVVSPGGMATIIE